MSESAAETEGGEPGASESAAETEGGEPGGARGTPEGRTQSRCRRRGPRAGTEGGEPGVSESAATPRRTERERERRTEAVSRARAGAPPKGCTKSLCRRRKPPHRSGETGKLKKATKKASHREAFFLSEFGSGRGVGFKKKGKAPDSA